MSKKYRAGIVLSERYDHLDAQMQIIWEAFNHCDKVIVVLLNSQRSRNLLNPFTFQERAELVQRCLPSGFLARLTIVGLEAYSDPEVWKRKFHETVLQVRPDVDFEHFGAIVVHADSSRSSFSESSFEDLASQAFGKGLPQLPVKPYHSPPDEASWRRAAHLHFSASADQDFFALHQGTTGHQAASYLMAARGSDWYQALQKEHKAIVEYRKKYPNDPFKPFETSDAIVINRQNGVPMVLLVVRGGDVGAGLLAIPGGFRNEGESGQEGAFRELKEETSLSFSPEEIRSGIVCATNAYSGLYRSPRGRIRTEAFVIDITNLGHKSVQAADDAADTCWFPLYELPAFRERFFEDHYEILRDMLKLDHLDSSQNPYLQPAEELPPQPQEPVLIPNKVPFGPGFYDVSRDTILAAAKKAYGNDVLVSHSPTALYHDVLRFGIQLGNDGASFGANFYFKEGVFR